MMDARLIGDHNGHRESMILALGKPSVLPLRHSYPDLKAYNVWKLSLGGTNLIPVLSEPTCYDQDCKYLPAH